jgi:hypothetical protein
MGGSVLLCGSRRQYIRPPGGRVCPPERGPAAVRSHHTSSDRGPARGPVWALVFSLLAWAALVLLIIKIL